MMEFNLIVFPTSSSG